MTIYSRDQKRLDDLQEAINEALRFVEKARVARAALQAEAESFYHSKSFAAAKRAMLINAQALINMARKRLCMKAHPETRLLMEHIKDCMKPVDPDLARYMVPECVYRGDVCHELKPCGKMTI